MPRIAAITYGETSGIVRRITVADSIKELGTPYGAGESIVIVTAEEAMKFDPQKKRTVPSLSECYALVEEKRGRPSDSDRCAVIDDLTGDILGTIHADPNVDRVTGKTLYQHLEADVGWTVDKKGEFVPPIKGTSDPTPEQVATMLASASVKAVR